jgi:hypothetical protein
MTTTATLHPAAIAYIKRLRLASRRLPRDARQDLLGDIQAHLHEALAGDPSEAEVLMILDRLGDPDEIVAAQLSDSADVTASPRGGHEWAAVILLLLGGFVFGVGWLIGLVLLWSSRAWSTVDKLIGTLLLPGGAATCLPILLLTGSKRLCTQGPGFPTRCTNVPSSTPVAWVVVLFAASVLIPAATAVHLARRAQRPH